MSLRRAATISVKNGAVASYVHSAVAPGLGKIGVIVGLESSGNPEKLAQIGRQVAMHVAAANPLAVRAEDIDQEVVNRERSIFAEQARESGKPEAIIEKMVDGRVRKFYEEVVLLSQAFVVDTDNTVEKALKGGGSYRRRPDHGDRVRGLPPRRGASRRRRPDFAAEVAAAAGVPPAKP